MKFKLREVFVDEMAAAGVVDSLRIKTSMDLAFSSQQRWRNLAVARVRCEQEEV